MKPPWLLCPLTEPSVSLIERIKRRMVRMNATSGAELTSLPVTCRRNSTVGGSYYVITASDTAFIQTSPFFRVEKGGKSFLGGHEWKNLYIICKYLVDTISQNRRSRLIVQVDTIYQSKKQFLYSTESDSGRKKSPPPSKIWWFYTSLPN